MNVASISSSVPAFEGYTRVCQTKPLLECAGRPSTGIKFYSWGLKPVKKVLIPRLSEVTLAVHLGGVRRLRIFTENGISERFSRPGDITIVPRSQPIEYLIEGPVTFATMHFPDSATSLFGDSGSRLIDLPHCLFAVRDDYTHASVQTLLKASRVTSIDASHYRAKVLEALAWHLLHVVSDNKVEPVQLAQQQEEVRVEPGSADFSAVLDEIERRMGDRLQIDELADIAGLGRTAFCEQFARQFGCPPHRFIVNRRIARAKELLGSQRWSVTEVAYQLGFSSASHFSATFKTITGITPKQYLSGLATR
ncbi:MAG: helix-turn-helix transcriptional regulator [Pseudomonadales bacterium]|nr:helix-turn-helix transcriptional regulator [Pseudomonadales bacterium]